MPTVRGQADIRRFITGLPKQFEDKVLRGAARAAGKVVLEEAKARSVSTEVDEALVLKTRRTDGHITVVVTVDGRWASSVANWLEYGTAPHFISVETRDLQGLSIGKFNDKSKDKSLVIGGKFVGKTVFHKGSKKYPFLRISLDTKADEALAAAQTYVNARVTRAGLIGSAEPEGGDE